MLWPLTLANRLIDHCEWKTKNVVIVRTTWFQLWGTFQMG